MCFVLGCKSAPDRQQRVLPELTVRLSGTAVMLSAVAVCVVR
jgi:hypothetical protein